MPRAPLRPMASIHVAQARRYDSKIFRTCKTICHRRSSRITFRSISDITRLFMHAICIRVFGPKETRYFSSPPALLRFKLLGIAQAKLLVYMMRMALVSGGSSRLNPDAPLFIPAALRRVEDFSPAWWELINTSMWFRDYWLSQHQEEADIFQGNDEDNLDDVDIADLLPSDVDIVDLLPDDIYLGVDDDVLNMESQLEEFIPSRGNRESNNLPKTGNEQAMEPANYQENPTGFASSEAAP